MKKKFEGRMTNGSFPLSFESHAPLGLEEEEEDEVRGRWMDEGRKAWRAEAEGSTGKKRGEISKQAGRQGLFFPPFYDVFHPRADSLFRGWA